MSDNKIAISKIRNENVREAVFKTLQLINAKNLFLEPNLKVLLKPNLLLAKEPERAATTHPEVLRAVIQWVKQFNPEKIIVAESSGTFKLGATEKAFEECGLKQVCEEEGVEWTSFGKTQRKTYKVENPLILEEITTSSLLEEVDLIINLPKIKTHGQCILTCVIKNMFGTLILGNKASTHARFPKREDFNAALTDIYSVSQPELTIIDGYYAMEGNGPSAGDVVKMDLILAGFDPVALETVVCEIINFNRKEIYYIQQAESKGLGTTDLTKMELLGDPIDEVKRPFKPPKGSPISVPLPRFIADYVSKAIFRSSIKFDEKKCRLCGTCWENCPADAITPPEVKKKGNTPEWDSDKCITCYCCAELCPYEAVDFKVNIVKNVLTSWLLLPILIILGGFIGLIWWIVSIFL